MTPGDRLRMATEGLPEGWTVRPLGSIASWFSGGTPSKAVRRFWDGPIPWVSPKDMKAFDLEDVADHVSQAGVDHGSCTVPAEAIFIVVRGMILAHTFPVSVAGRPMAFNQDVKGVVANPDVCSRYLAYWFVANAHDLLGLATASTHGTKKIDLPDLVQFPVRLPPLRAQQRIAEILDAANEAISGAEAVVAKLRVQRDGAMRYRTTAPLSAELTRLGDVLAFPPRNGYSPQESPTRTGRYMLGLGCLTVDGYAPVHLKHAPVADPRVDDALLEDGDLLLSRSNTSALVGLPGVYREIGAPCAYPDLMMRLKAGPRTSNAYLEALLRSPSVRRQIVANAVGTSASMVKISARVVSNLRVHLPDMVEQERTLVLGCAFTDRIRAEEACLEKLKLQKQGLMQDLLTGRVRVNA